MTTAEKFAYELCIALHCPHPDYLNQLITWEQFSGWQDFYGEQPFGETREDLRAMANTLWTALCGSPDQPDLIYPYFATFDPDEFIKRTKALDEKVAEMRANGA